MWKIYTFLLWFHDKRNILLHAFFGKNFVKLTFLLKKLISRKIFLIVEMTEISWNLLFRIFQFKLVSLKF